MGDDPSRQGEICHDRDMRLGRPASLLVAAAPVEDAFPIIRHAATSFLRSVLRIDVEPLSLDVDDFSHYDLDVLVEVRN